VTARLAGELGREVLAVPGPVLRGAHKGCHRLLREGAAVCEEAEDVLAALGLPVGPSAAAGGRPGAPGPRDPEEAAAFAGLEEGRTLSIDEVARRSGLDVRRAALALSALERLGLARREAAGWTRA
jgi:DNA processing protein